MKSLNGILEYLSKSQGANGKTKNMNAAHPQNSGSREMRIQIDQNVLCIIVLVLSILVSPWFLFGFLFIL